MNKRFLAVTLLILFLIAPVIPAAAQSIPTMPALCYGELTIDGYPAPVATLVVAKVEDIERGSLETTEEGWYGGPGLSTKLAVSGVNLTGKDVHFYISGSIMGTDFENVFAGKEPYWGSGNTKQIDLTVQGIVTTPDPDPVQYTLSISREGQGSTLPGVGNHSYEEGTRVNLQASAADGWRFDKWVVNGITYTTATLAVNMNGNKAAKAYFVMLESSPDPGSPPGGDPAPSDPPSGDPDPSDPPAEDPKPEEGPEEKPEIKPGDVFGDGKVDVQDATYVMQFVLGLRDLTDEQQQAADVNGDGVVDVLDVVLIIQYILGFIVSFG